MKRKLDHELSASQQRHDELWAFTSNMSMSSFVQTKEGERLPLTSLRWMSNYDVLDTFHVNSQWTQHMDRMKQTFEHQWHCITSIRLYFTNTHHSPSIIVMDDGTTFDLCDVSYSTADVLMLRVYSATSFLQAIDNRYLADVKRHIQHGVHVNAMTSDLPIERALHARNPDIFHYLLEQPGVNVNHIRSNLSLLQRCMHSFWQPHVIDSFARAKADFQWQDRNGNNVLHTFLFQENDLFQESGRLTRFDDDDVLSTMAALIRFPFFFRHDVDMVHSPWCCA